MTVRSGEEAWVATATPRGGGGCGLRVAGGMNDDHQHTPLPMVLPAILARLRTTGRRWWPRYERVCEHLAHMESRLRRALFCIFRTSLVSVFEGGEGLHRTKRKIQLVTITSAVAPEVTAARIASILGGGGGVEHVRHTVLGVPGSTQHSHSTVRTRSRPRPRSHRSSTMA